MSRRQPKDCTEMVHVREAIDEIDKQLVDLVAQRFGYVDRAWQIKQHGPEGAVVPWRIQQVIDKVRADLSANKMLQRVALPARFGRIMVSRYEPGM